MAKIIKKAYFTKGLKYYCLILRRDLLDDWIVIKLHGSRRTGQAKMVSQPFNSYEKALAHYKAMHVFRVIACNYQCVREN